MNQAWVGSCPRIAGSVQSPVVTAILAPRFARRALMRANSATSGSFDPDDVEASAREGGGIRAETAREVGTTLDAEGTQSVGPVARDPGRDACSSPSRSKGIHRPGFRTWFACCPGRPG